MGKGRRRNRVRFSNKKLISATPERTQARDDQAQMSADEPATIALALRPHNATTASLTLSISTPAAPVEVGAAARDLLYALQIKFNGEFSVEKLIARSSVDMDVLMPTVWLDRRRLEQFGLPIRWLALEPSITLMAAAAYMGRDNILSSLVRAGADPLRRCAESYAGGGVDCARAIAEARPRARALLCRVPLAYACWIMRAVVHMRAAGAQARADRGAVPTSCALCGGEALPRMCWGQPCGHIFCEPCVWSSMSADLKADEPLCPAPGCGARRPEAPDEAEEPLPPTAAESLALWEALPEEPLLSLGKAEKKQPKARRVFCAAPSLRSSFHFRKGDTRTQRSDAFLGACSDGLLPFFEHLLRCGVNINARNEYGQTPLALAAENGHQRLVSELLALGADTSLTANDGCTSCVTFCAARGFDEIARLLLEHGAPPGPPIISKSSAEKCAVPARCQVRCVVPSTADRMGAFVIDDAFSLTELEELDALFASLPVHQLVLSKLPERKREVARRRAESGKPACPSERRYHMDASGRIRALVQGGFERAGLSGTETYAHMRFLDYAFEGGVLPAHIDLRRYDPVSGRASTHTLILYLSDCDEGGETAILRSDLSNSLRELDGGAPSRGGGANGGPSASKEGETSEVAGGPRDGKGGAPLAVVAPRRGRLFVFPHRCLHEGRRTVSVPKVLLRGECYMDPRNDTADRARARAG